MNFSVRSSRVTGAQFTRHRPEDTRTDRLALVIKQDRRIAIKLDQRAIRTTHALGGTNHHSAVNVTLLDTTTRGRILDTHLDDVTHPGVATLGAAQHLDAHHITCAGIIGHVQHRLHLDHLNSPT